MTEPLLEIENLYISFDTQKQEIPAVIDFSCKIMPGEVLGLVGESGCGKSTVALAIMQYLGKNGYIKSGTIKFKGKNLNTLSLHELRKIRGSEIAMIYQEPMASLNPTMRVGEQLTEVLRLHEVGITKQDAYLRVLDMLVSVKLPDPKRIMHTYPHQLSGGQQQRIGIAMALLGNPDLLIMDEPTTSLDVTVEAGVIQLVKELSKKFGNSILFISHNLGLVLEICQKISVMYSSRVIEQGSVRQIFNSMRHPYTRGLFNSLPLPSFNKNKRQLVSIPGQLPLPNERPQGCAFSNRCTYYVQGTCDKEMAMIDLGEGHMTHCTRVKEIDWSEETSLNKKDEGVEIGNVILNLSNLKKYYHVVNSDILGSKKTKTIKANEDISFDVREAETVAIVGESGCGKSTLAKMLLGLEQPTHGSIHFNGQEIANIPVSLRDTETIKAIQMIFQNPFDTLNPSHTVGSQIIRTLEKFNVGNTHKDRRAHMFELLDLVKLPSDFENRMPRQLSGGQKQRIGIARAFAAQPKILVADEPVSALDVSVQAAITELLINIQNTYRTTMIFISHDLSIVKYLSDKIVVMYLGYVVEQGTAEQVFSPPYHPYTEALLSAVPIADTSVKKRHIVLENDIPSAIDPPSGCPFQTRCHRKKHVLNNLCEKEVPPIRSLNGKHNIRCHLADEILESMEPVIGFNTK